MEKRKTVFSDFFILVVSLIFLLSFFSTMFGMESLSSLCFHVSIFIVIFATFLEIILTKRLNLLIMCLTLLIIVSFIFSFIEAGVRTDLSYYKRFLVTLSVFFCINFAHRVSITEKSKKIIQVIFFVSSLILVFSFYFGGYNELLFGSTTAIALNFSNPNTTGLWLLAFITINLISLNSVKKKSYKIVILAVTIALFPILYATEARNALIAAILLVLFYIVYLFRGQKNTPKFILFLLVISPIVVFLVYMYIVVPMSNLSIDFIGIDKGIYNRRSIWQEVIDNMPKCFFIGRYDMYNEAQLHNSLLTLICTYGVPFTILASYLMYFSCVKLQEENSPFAAIAMCAIFVSGCFEASIFVGVAGLYLITIIIPACISPDINSGVIKKEK